MLLRRRIVSEPRRASLQLNEWTRVGEKAGSPDDTEPSAARRSWRALTDSVKRSYTHLRVAFAERFAQHGHWISCHQTRSILLCNVVIASLFYPAVVMYLLTTSEDPSSMASAPACLHRNELTVGHNAACVTGSWMPNNIWDMALASILDLTGASRADIVSDMYPVQDLRLVWDETPSLQVVREPNVSAPKVHVAQVLVTSDATRRAGGSPYGVLHPRLLLSALALQEALDARLLHPTEKGAPSCVRRNETESCLVLSPLEFWGRDAERLRHDGHPAQSYTGSPVRAVVTPPVAPMTPHSPLPLLYSTTLSGRWPYLPLFSRAEYLVLTYFLEDAPTDAWPSLVQDAASSVAAAQVRVPPGIESGSTVLEFQPQAVTERPKLHYKVVIVGYLLLLLFIFRELVQMRRLHTRFGMVFTGSVQLIIDLIMSLSLCALLGIRLTAVPWSILPFIIVLVGGETMLFVIRTITNTPLSLTVNARVAYGLSQVAGPITISAAVDVMMLCLFGYLVRLEAVKQFVLFTICALVADYFMQMTFFVTVLSIDIQRLELAEVLLQGARVPSVTATAADVDVPAKLPPYRPHSASSVLIEGVRRVLRMRAPQAVATALAAGVGAVMLVAWLPSILSSHGLIRLLGSSPVLPSLEQYSDAELDMSPYGAFWRAINPDRALYVRMVLDPWVLVSWADTMLPSRGAHQPPGPWLEALFYDRRGTTLFLLVLFVVGPIALSTLILSVVLHYLQQNSDKLEASHQPGDNAELWRLLHADTPPEHVMALQLVAHTHELHEGPILFLAAAPGVCVSVDTHNTLRIEEKDIVTLYSLATQRTEQGLQADGTPIMALAADEGRIVWGQVSGRVSYMDLNTRKVVDLSCCPIDASFERPSAPVQQVLWQATHAVSLHGDGSVWAWPLASNTGISPLVPSLPGAWTAAPLSSALPGTWLAAASSRGHLAVYGLHTEGVERVGLVQSHGGLIRCAALGPPVSLEEEPSTERPPRLSPPRTTPGCTSPLPSPTHWLLTGGQDGTLRLWVLPRKGPAATLALEAPADGAIRSIDRVRPTQFLVQTANRVWLVQVQGTREQLKLVLLDSLPNVRGVADVYPHSNSDPVWLLGMRRADHTAEARWDVWRARLPSGDAAVIPAPERIPVAVEWLLREAVRDSIAQGHHPPARLPLLATRLHRMVRSDGDGQWRVPFGSAVLALTAEWLH
ncbi:hypothetical protein MEQU1_002680 [Malassezia equina]|uniref:Sterol regulatory element-binding protein cleavage-activating protein n=1 Tax=Malassezia equina TaxID=1381935 RepID=A0AAF0EE98_9BASI|nr:hypothetical protein MEQU1_002680 [Malassezia equina]